MLAAEVLLEIQSPLLTESAALTIVGLMPIFCIQVVLLVVEFKTDIDLIEFPEGPTVHFTVERGVLEDFDQSQDKVVDVVVLVDTVDEQLFVKTQSILERLLLVFIQEVLQIVHCQLFYFKVDILQIFELLIEGVNDVCIEPTLFPEFILIILD